MLCSLSVFESIHKFICQLITGYCRISLQLSLGWMKMSRPPAVQRSPFINSILRTVFSKTQMPSTAVKAPNFCARTQWPNTWRRWDFVKWPLLRTVVWLLCCTTLCKFRIHWLCYVVQWSYLMDEDVKMAETQYTDWVILTLMSLFSVHAGEEQRTGCWVYIFSWPFDPSWAIQPIHNPLSHCSYNPGQGGGQAKSLDMLIITYNAPGF